MKLQWANGVSALVAFLPSSTSKLIQDQDARVGHAAKKIGDKWKYSANHS